MYYVIILLVAPPYNIYYLWHNIYYLHIIIIIIIIYILVVVFLGQPHGMSSIQHTAPRTKFSGGWIGGISNATSPAANGSSFGDPRSDIHLNKWYCTYLHALVFRACKLHVPMDRGLEIIVLGGHYPQHQSAVCLSYPWTG